MQSLYSSKKSFNRKKWLVGIFALIIIVTAGLYIAKLGPFSPSNHSVSDTTNDQDKKKDTPTDEPGITDPSSNSSKNPDATDRPDQSTEKGIQITNAYLNGDTFQIRTLIPTVTTEGGCTLKMTAPGKAEYTATAGVQALSSSSTCKGFDIPASSLGTGTWTISVTYTSASSTSTATKEVVINA